MLSTGSRILIVHHDEHALMVLEYLLEVAGFSTTSAWDTEKAIAAIGRSRFDAVLIGDRPPLITASRIISQAWASQDGTEVNCFVAEGDACFPKACLTFLKLPVGIHWGQSASAPPAPGGPAERAS